MVESGDSLNGLDGNGQAKEEKVHSVSGASALLLRLHGIACA